MVREIAYDEVFDAQRHYRSLLDSMARPGKISRLDTVALNPPPSLNAASALLAFALMDAESTFEVVNLEHGAGAYLGANTNARRTGIADAHFIFAHGTESPAFLESADCGTLLYPDTAATVVLQIDNASIEALSGGWKLTLTGPGIDGTATLFAKGISIDLLLALQARNAEFPLGLDTILTFGESLVCLPRTTRVSWEEC